MRVEGDTIVRLPSLCSCVPNTEELHLLLNPVVCIATGGLEYAFSFLRLTALSGYQACPTRVWNQTFPSPRPIACQG